MIISSRNCYHAPSLRGAPLATRQSSAGFTLLELLVVIIIIGLASTIILIKMSSFVYSNRRSEFLAKEIAAMLDLAKKQAIFSMSVIGLQINPSDYVFVRLDDSKGITWKPLADTDTFWNARQIPSNIVVNVDSDQMLQKTLFQGSQFNPQIIILPNGEINPFTISIHKLGNSQTYTIKNNDSGGMSIDVTH